MDSIGQNGILTQFCLTGKPMFLPLCKLSIQLIVFTKVCLSATRHKQAGSRCLQQSCTVTSSVWILRISGWEPPGLGSEMSIINHLGFLSAYDRAWCKMGTEKKMRSQEGEQSGWKNGPLVFYIPGCFYCSLDIFSKSPSILLVSLSVHSVLSVFQM